MASNLASQLNQRLSPEVQRLLRMAGEIALEGGHGLYLVGGAVRDLFLGRANFGTAKLRHQNLTIDLATCRAETYSHPGALPTVHPGSIADDLSRRDFTINAMAIRLDPDNFGQLVDPFQGERDLAHKLIRVLHPRSFVDDATRMLRAVRYEQRFDFRLEAATEELLKRDLSMIHTISGDRIRHELELIFKEARPEKPLRRAAELCLLQEIHAALKGNGWIAKAFEQARSTANPPSLGLYLSLAVHHFSRDEAEDLITSLNIPKATARVIQDTLSLRENLASLEAPQLSPSAIYRLLQDYSPTSILAWAIASESPLIRQRLHLYLDRLRYVKSSLNGQDLQNMGLPPGPRMGQMLKALHEAKLDQKAKTRAEEVALVRRWLSQE